MSIRRPVSCPWIVFLAAGALFGASLPCLAQQPTAPTADIETPTDDVETPAADVETPARRRTPPTTRGDNATPPARRHLR